MMLGILGFNATSLQKNDPWNVLSLAKEAGLNYVELTAGRGTNAMIRPDSTEDDIKEILRRVRQYGLGICAIGAHRDLSQPEQLEQFQNLLSIAAFLQCPVVTTGIPDGCNGDAYAEGLYTAAQRANECGIAICLETHGYEHGSGRSLLPFAQVHSAVKLCYDTGNVFYYSDTTPDEDLPLCLPLVRHVHLKDKLGGKGEWNFPAAGEGCVDFDAVLHILQNQKELSGSIEIEFTPEGVSLADTQKALLSAVHYLRNLPLMRCDE